MSEKSAKIIFYGGTLISAILFLYLTFDTHRQVGVLTHADKLSEDVVAGKKVFQKYNCNDCHTILGFGGYYAPDLTKVYQRRGPEYIRNILTQPEVVLEKSFRKMPQQHVSPEEINHLVAFFQWVGEINNQNWPPQDAKAGRKAGVNRLLSSANMSAGAALFKENGCFACHKLQGVGGDIGPDLDDVGSRLSQSQIEQQIVNPNKLNPGSVMPPFPNLSEQDLKALAEFLSKQKGGAE